MFSSVAMQFSNCNLIGKYGQFVSIYIAAQNRKTSSTIIELHHVVLVRSLDVEARAVIAVYSVHVYNTGHEL